MTGKEAGAIEQGALFGIEVDDDDGCAWLVTTGPVINLGPAGAVAEKLTESLATRDFAE